VDCYDVDGNFFRFVELPLGFIRRADVWQAFSEIKIISLDPKVIALHST
jgi:hypothetical protein